MNRLFGMMLIVAVLASGAYARDPALIVDTAGTSRLQTPAEMAQQDLDWAANAAAEAVQLEKPTLQPRGVLTPIVWLSDATGLDGPALVAYGDELLIVPGWGASRKSLVDARADAAAKAAANAATTADMLANRAASTNHAANANSVPALQEAVQELQLQVDALMILLGVTP